ncbi:hypothetical protein C8R44DRAFT_871991 [Mycena epipterygia]|nr:hypothetical protein C8R44DRAFT_871991 [Mycena epipterygia]
MEYYNKPEGVFRDVRKLQLRFLANTTDTPAIRVVLSLMTANELFKTALISKDLYNKVADFLDYVRREGAQAIESTDAGYSSDGDSCSADEGQQEDVQMDGSIENAFSSFPSEVLLYILRYMDLEDRQRFAQASRECCELSAQSLQRQGAALLRSVDLRFEEIRLMQEATGSMITGALLVSLLQFHSVGHSDDVNVVTGWGEGGPVVEFIEMCSDYKTATFTGNHESHTGIAFSWTLLHAHTGRKLHISESRTSSPVDAIAQSPSSCVVGGWGAYDVWHGYPALMHANMAICTATTMPVINGLAGQQEIWTFLHLFAAHDLVHGFDGFEDVHVCGAHPSCPATLRTTDDAGCLRARFPLTLYHERVHTEYVTCWALGGKGCPAGILSRSGRRTEQVSADRENDWKRIMKGFMAAQSAPMYAVALAY